MNDLALAGCRAEPLGSYLKALGVLRLIADQADTGARGRWSGAGTFVLSTALDREQLVAFFVDNYRPTPLVAPWNSGSGFRVGGKSPTAEALVRLIEQSVSPRLEPYRRAIAAAREVVRRAEDAGWREPTGKEFWRKEAKPHVLRLCRALLPDDALAWLEACVVLTDDEKWSPLLGGSGGVLGHLELSVNYAQNLVAVLALGTGRKAPTAADSADWAEAALFGDRSVRHIRGPVGQFDPSKAGGILSSPLEDRDKEGFLNPWDFVLTLEGALLFASAAARRLGSASAGRATLPFMVAATPVGYSSSAEGESPRGELWAPLWRRPAGAAEVARLISEGRADWGGRQAATGLDFVRAAATLGVDRGVTGFARHVFVERHGQSLLAVPVGRVAVREMPQVGLLGEVDRWLEHVRRGKNPPSAVRRGIRGVEAAMFEVARGGHQGVTTRLQDVLVALAELELAVGRSSGFRDKAGIRPVRGLAAGQWVAAVDDGSPELRLAAALAAAHDNDGSGLRSLVRPVGLDGGRFDWTVGPAPVPGFGVAPVVDVLALAHARRAVERLSAAGADPVGTKRLLRLSFDHQPVQATVADVARLIEGTVDEGRLGQLLGGLMLLDWRWAPQHRWPDGAGVGDLPVPDAVWPLLVPFFHGRAMKVRVASTGRGERAEVDVPELQPEAAWPAGLLAGRVCDVARRAVVRLRMAHLDPVVLAPHVDDPTSRGPRLAAALLCPVPDYQVNRLLSRVAASPDPEGGP